MLDQLTEQVVAFRDERDWRQFHSARNLASSISIEAAELLELFQWSTDATMDVDVERNRTDLSREIADILIYALLLAHDTGIDPSVAIREKLAENAAKYPVEKARGTSDKYTKL